MEICDDGQWLTVCGDMWSARNTEVVCRSLGFADAPGCMLFLILH